MKCECAPHLSHFEVLGLIFIGIIRAHIKCPGERQLRRTLSNTEVVQDEKGGGGSQVPKERIMDK